MKKSAGILLFKRDIGVIRVLLVHPGGPFWAKKDENAWSIPKGEFDEEEPLRAAIREFNEEMGCSVSGEFIELQAVKQPSGKLVFAWALESDFDVTTLKSNTFSMEWPRGSKVMREYPEIDRAAWFSIPEAKLKILKGQVPFLAQLLTTLNISLEELNKETPNKSLSREENQQLDFLR